MAEEDKKKAGEEGAQAEKPAEKKEEQAAVEKKAEKQEEPQAEKPQGKKRRKISRMTLAEVESELKAVREKMGSFQSRFARHLLARKKELTT